LFHAKLCRPDGTFCGSVVVVPYCILSYSLDLIAMDPVKQDPFSSPTGPAKGGADPQYAPPAGVPPPPPAYIKDVSMKDTANYNTDAHLLAACRAKGISPYFATQITRLREYSSIRLVLDDSGSMKAMLNVYGQPPRSRWQLLQTMVKEIFDLMTVARGRDPVDVHFLNMLPGGMKADSVDQLQTFFNTSPNGTTPTLEVMRDIMTPEHMIHEEGVLTLLITDGAPNCGHQAFRNFLLDAQRRYPASYITVGLCTDDPATVNEYEQSLDNGVPHLDVMSSYEEESREIRRIQGRRFGFTYADWTVKFLLGSRITEWDSLDERKLSKRELEMIQKFGNAYLGVSGGAGGATGMDKKKKDCVIM
jgi:hypothetical protein